MNPFITLAEAARQLAGEDVDAIDAWIALLAADAEQLRALKSWTTGRSTVPGGVSFFRDPKDWEIPRHAFRAWLIANGYLESDQVPTQPISSGSTTRHKLRTDSLDVPIMKAIAAAGSLATAAVFVQLRELALEGCAPFTGVIDGDALCYTRDNNTMGKLTKDALRKRLKNHAKPSS